ncbi:MAG: hypothetical protein EON52_16200 [Actinomycetales bacterium]|nr:MAG: hypothetical protein EON52_16200 [Actinomycetales bacterium]
MGIKQDQSVYNSSLDIGAIRQVLRGALGGKVEISPIQFDALDEPPEFAILVEKRTFASNSAFQVYIETVNDRRHITLIALGDGGLSTIAQVASTNGFNKGNVRLGKSRQLVAEVVQALRTHDSSLQQIG